MFSYKLTKLKSSKLTYYLNLKNLIRYSYDITTIVRSLKQVYFAKQIFLPILV